MIGRVFILIVLITCKLMVVMVFKTTISSISILDAIVTENRPN
jgi:hypothetical protein